MFMRLCVFSCLLCSEGYWKFTTGKWWSKQQGWKNDRMKRKGPGEKLSWPDAAFSSEIVALLIISIHQINGRHYYKKYKKKSKLIFPALLLSPVFSQSCISHCFWLALRKKHPVCAHDEPHPVQGARCWSRRRRPVHNIHQSVRGSCLATGPAWRDDESRLPAGSQTSVGPRRTHISTRCHDVTDE